VNNDPWPHNSGHHYHGEFADNSAARMLGCAMLLTLILLIVGIAVTVLVVTR